MQKRFFNSAGFPLLQTDKQMSACLRLLHQAGETNNAAPEELSTLLKAVIRSGQPFDDPADRRKLLELLTSNHAQSINSVNTPFEQLLYNLTLLYLMLLSDSPGKSNRLIAILAEVNSITLEIKSHTEPIEELAGDDLYTTRCEGLTNTETAVYITCLSRVFDAVYSIRGFSFLSFPVLRANFTDAGEEYLKLRSMALEYLVADFKDIANIRKSKYIYTLLFCAGGYWQLPSLATHLTRLALFENNFIAALYFTAQAYDEFFIGNTEVPAYVRGRILFLSLLCAGIYFGVESDQYTRLANCMLHFIFSNSGSGIVNSWSLVDAMIDEYTELRPSAELLHRIAAILSGVKQPELFSSNIDYLQSVYNQDAFAGYPPALWEK